MSKIRKVVPLFSGSDPRIDVFVRDLKSFIYKHGEKFTLATVLGALRVVEHDLIEGMKE